MIRLLGLLVTLVPLSTAAFEWVAEQPERDVIKKEYAVQPGGTLHLDLDRGNIEVEVTDQDRVFIELERVARADNKDAERKMLDMHEYSFDKRGEDVFVVSRYSADRYAWRLHRRPNLKINLTVRVPEEYNVQFENGAGNVELYDVEGRIEGRTGAGNIVVDGVEGRVEVFSGAGNIDISGDIDAVDAHTGAGNIALDGVGGSVQAASGAGNIDAVIVDQPKGDSRFRTGAGNIVVSMDEDISIYVHATAALGSARCEFPLEVNKKFLSKSFSGPINGGGAQVTMHSGVGNVVLERL